MKAKQLLEFILASLILCSCGDNELEPARDNEYQNDTLPSFVIEALNNAKRLYDNIGELRQITLTYSTFSAQDEYGNTINIDLYGNVDITPNAGNGISIDWSIKESKGAQNDTICNTVWRGTNNYSYRHETMNLPGNYGYDFYNLIVDANAKIDVVSSYDTKQERYREYPTGYRELKFKNTACILTCMDTINYCKDHIKTLHEKIKIEEQSWTYNGEHFRIEIMNDTIFFHHLTPKEEGNESAGYWDAIIDIKALDSDGTFDNVVSSEIESTEFIRNEAHYNCVAFNYRRLPNGDIELYNSSEDYQSYVWLNGKLCFTLPIIEMYEKPGRKGNIYGYTDIEFIRKK